ncbi:MAG: hypothetical protein O3C40_29015 [Planctomycetota bacterium]|nr:hypothetical protein [Planctomycetota bacterium]
MTHMFEISSPSVLWLERRRANWGDYEALLHQLDDRLRFFGFDDMTEAERALQARHTSEFGKPCLVITDSFSLDFTKFVKEHTPGIPTVLFSRRATQDPAKTEQFTTDGFLDKFVPKPQVSQLKSTIAAFVRTVLDSPEMKHFHDGLKTVPVVVATSLELVAWESVWSPDGVKHWAQPFVEVLRKRRETVELPSDLDVLYLEFASLNSELTDRPDDQELVARIDDCFENLRVLQEREADQIEKRLENSLALRFGEGNRVIQHAEELIRKYENPAQCNPTSADSDDAPSFSG